MYCLCIKKVNLQQKGLIYSVYNYVCSVRTAYYYDKYWQKTDFYTNNTNYRVWFVYFWYEQEGGGGESGVKIINKHYLQRR